ncbi:Rieske 2Fe-2S domain-containing protein [Sphingobium tyrosinilyticum]|uniref:Rieske 2Fe-2S domain-containing protein n=1 Tax=Sphingobium tyrosinilyticum TaxID=2715436 RepID=A0ABV9F2I5_9SPHN
MANTADYGLGEFSYPRGWFMVAASAELRSAPLAVRYFGQDMVIYRGQSGRVMLMDAYCPHMGTHLAHGSSSYIVRDGMQIEGDSIRCPYHGWRFGPDGKCDDIPYSPAPIPKAACIRTWPVVERAGCVFVWYDPEGGEPDYDLPSFAEWDDPRWVNWTIDPLGELPCHPVEIIDNIGDKAHLEPIHGSIDMQRFENVFDAHVVWQHLRAGHRTLAGREGEYMVNDTSYTGPGILQSWMAGEYPSIMLFCHTPVDEGCVKLWHGLTVKSAEAVASAETIAAVRPYQEASCAALSQDIQIWRHKRACLNPMVVQGDGPFGKVRIWYRQFFNPRARAGEYQMRVKGATVTRGTAEAPWTKEAVA